MKVCTRKCIEPFETTAENGDRLELIPGKVYTTTFEDADGMLTVFSRFWVYVPAKFFTGGTPLGAKKAGRRAVALKVCTRKYHAARGSEMRGGGLYRDRAARSS